MANDSGDGDDLFEDLDKFFAPIKDVDWDEPEGEPERTPPASHVEVRQEQPADPEPEEPSTITVIVMGVYPAPIGDTLQTSVTDLLKHVAVSKVP